MAWSFERKAARAFKASRALKARLQTARDGSCQLTDDESDSIGHVFLIYRFHSIDSLHLIMPQTASSLTLFSVHSETLDNDSYPAQTNHFNLHNLISSVIFSKLF